MARQQSTKAQSDKAADKLKSYKWILERAFEFAQLSAAPPLPYLLKRWFLDQTENEPPAPLKLHPWPRGEFDPCEAMQELERVVEMDDLGTPRLVRIPGLPLWRYVGPLGRISDQKSRARPIPRDDDYRKAYHFAVGLYFQTYHGSRKRGRPRAHSQEHLQKLLEMKEQYSYAEMVRELGYREDSREERDRSKERVRKQVKVAEQLLGKRKRNPSTSDS